MADGGAQIVGITGDFHLLEFAMVDFYSIAAVAEGGTGSLGTDGRIVGHEAAQGAIGPGATGQQAIVHLAQAVILAHEAKAVQATAVLVGVVSKKQGVPGIFPLLQLQLHVRGAA